jgi:hypothetical protein
MLEHEPSPESAFQPITTNHVTGRINQQYRAILFEFNTTTSSDDVCMLLLINGILPHNFKSNDHLLSSSETVAVDISKAVGQLGRLFHPSNRSLLRFDPHYSDFATRTECFDRSITTTTTTTTTKTAFDHSIATTAFDHSTATEEEEEEDATEHSIAPTVFKTAFDQSIARTGTTTAFDHSIATTAFNHLTATEEEEEDATEHSIAPTVFKTALDQSIATTTVATQEAMTFRTPPPRPTPPPGPPPGVPPGRLASPPPPVPPAPDPNMAAIMANMVEAMTAIGSKSAST